MAAPKTANINITIGNKEYIVNHKNFSSLKIKRTAKDVSDSFTLNILDNDAYEIESILLSGNNYMSVSYIDDDLKVYKTLAGFAISMSSSFIDNRCMLEITGFLSNNIKDKYEKYSVPWNIVPKFDWEDVLGDASWSNVHDANYEEDAGLDKFLQDFCGFFKKGGQGLKAFFTWNWSAIDDYQTVIDRIFANDWLSIDASGNYYTQKYKDLKNDEDEDKSVMENMDSDKEYDNIVKSNGSYVIPIKPHKLLKLICCGGKFSDLLESEYSDYKGTAFYKSDYSEAEWYYIQKWYEKMGSFPGLGYKEFKYEEETEAVEDGFNQTRKSFMEYMYEDILPKCYRQEGNNKYTNFYLSFDKDNVVFKRLHVSNNQTGVPQYVYYGKFTNSGDNLGRMISFSPKLDILTSMIAQGTVSVSEADISTLNLITGINNEGVTKSASQATESGNRYNVKWGAVKVVPTVSSTANNKLASAKVAEIFKKAEELSYRASATISGFNKLNPQDYIDIIFMPKNDIGTPSYHHLSGQYFILSIEDTIQDGKFTSSLDLIKNVGSMGNTASISQVSAEAEKELKYTVSPVYRKTNSNSSLLEQQMETMTNPNKFY